VTLKVGGDQGTSFSGMCSAGGRKEVLEGRVPERYVYRPGESKLECEIRKESEGTLEIAVTGEGVDSVQRTDTQVGTIRFALSDGHVTSSTASVAQNQTIEASDGSFVNDSP
jgi:hypothetical protein